MDRTFLHMPGSVLHRGAGGEGGTVFPPLGEIIVLRDDGLLCPSITQSVPSISQPEEDIFPGQGI